MGVKEGGAEEGKAENLTAPILPGDWTDVTDIVMAILADVRASEARPPTP